MKEFERKRKLYASDAEECRQRGFSVGTRIKGNEGYGETVIEITAIGEKSILAKTVTHAGKVPYYAGYEGTWTLSCRDWEPIAEAETGGKA